VRFHHYFEDANVVRAVKDVVLYGGEGVTIILTSHQLIRPPDIQRYSLHFKRNCPTTDKIRKIIIDEAAVWQKNNSGHPVKTDSKTLDLMVNNFCGLTENDVKHSVRGAIVDGDAITTSDVTQVNKAKFELMDILSYEFDTTGFSDTGGLGGLKCWLA
jgi:hypothetical protein